MKTPYDKLAKIYTNCSGHMTKIANMPIYCKNALIDNARISSLQNLLLSILKIIEAFLDLTMKNMYI